MSEQDDVREGDTFEVKKDFQARSLRISSFHRNFKAGQVVEFLFFAPKSNSIVVKYRDTNWLVRDTDRKLLKGFPELLAQDEE